MRSGLGAASPKTWTDQADNKRAHYEPQPAGGSFFTMSQTCSDTTLGNLPAAMLSGDTTTDGDSVLVDASQDMFDTTLTRPMTSTQADAPTTETAPQPEQAPHLYTKTERLCVEGCSFRTSMTRKAKKIGPVQCHLCQHWIHPPCVGEKDEDIFSIWTCPTCRMMPGKLTTIIDTLTAMREENIVLKTLITTEASDIHNTIKDHCQKCDSKDIQTQKLSESLQEKIREHTQAMNEITNLRCKVSELNTKLSAQSWSSFRGHSSPRTVLLSSSIVRDISESRLLNTDVTSISINVHEHVSKLCNKAGMQVQVISRLSRVLSESNKMLLYSSFAECYFNYCCLIWHFCSNANTYKLDKLQKMALKFITLDFKGSYAQLLKKCNKRPLYIVRIYKCLEMVYRIVNHTCPSYLNNFIKLKNTSYSFSLSMRQSHMANEASITWPHFIGIHYQIKIKNKIH